MLAPAIASLVGRFLANTTQHLLIFQIDLEKRLENRNFTENIYLFKQFLSRFYVDYLNFILFKHNFLKTFNRNAQVRFPTTLGVNAFRGFVNSYVQERKLKCAPKKASVLQVINYLFFVVIFASLITSFLFI